MTWDGEAKTKQRRLTDLKCDLADVLGWPYLDNLTWFQVWQGGWCFHGRSSKPSGQNEQKSMNFEMDPSVTDAEKSLLLSIRKVKASPERLKQTVRWFCTAHSWEQTLPRGEMSGGCPQCGSYSCEPAKMG